MGEKTTEQGKKERGEINTWEKGKELNEAEQIGWIINEWNGKEKSKK